ncbi:MAG: ribonuclease HII [Gemmatimonadales bacterium]
MPSTVPIPSLRRERTLWAEDRLLIGVDEVGRGPLAGPVLAAAVVFAPDTPRVRGLRDSKVLSARQRERLAERIRDRALYIGLGAASTREIDRFNIRVATAVAMRRAVARVLSGAAGLRGGGAGELRTGVPSRHPVGLPPYRLTALPPMFHVLIDGLAMPELGYAHDALVDGDAHCYSIAAAGVVAKCVRDRLMVRLHGRHPAYGWETNKGYGTEEHRAAIDREGPTKHHRNSFSPVAQLRLFFGA